MDDDERWSPAFQTLIPAVSVPLYYQVPLASCIAPSGLWQLPHEHHIQWLQGEHRG